MKISFNGWYNVLTKNDELNVKTKEFIQKTQQLRYASQNTIKYNNCCFIHINDNYDDVFEREAKKYGISIEETNINEILNYMEDKDNFYSHADRLRSDLYKAFRNGAKINIKPMGKFNLVYVKEKNKPVKIFGLNNEDGKLLFEQHKNGKFTIQNFFDSTSGQRIGHLVFKRNCLITSDKYQQSHIIRNTLTQQEVKDFIINELKMPLGVIKEL